MDGNRLRDETVARLRGEIEALGSPPVCLATVLVGADRPSQIYVRMKQKKAEEAGMLSKGIEMPEASSQQEVEAAVADLVADRSVHGILVQLPLPDLSIPSRCWRCYLRRRTSTVSPSARWVAWSAGCPVTCRARRWE